MKFKYMQYVLAGLIAIMFFQVLTGAISLVDRINDLETGFYRTIKLQIELDKELTDRLYILEQESMYYDNLKGEGSWK